MRARIPVLGDVSVLKFACDLSASGRPPAVPCPLSPRYVEEPVLLFAPGSRPPDKLSRDSMSRPFPPCCLLTSRPRSQRLPRLTSAYPNTQGSDGSGAPEVAALFGAREGVGAHACAAERDVRIVVVVVVAVQRALDVDADLHLERLWGGSFAFAFMRRGQRCGGQRGTRGMKDKRTFGVPGRTAGRAWASRG